MRTRGTRDLGSWIPSAKGGESETGTILSSMPRQTCEIEAGLRHNFIQNTNSKIKHIQMPCIVQTYAFFDEDRGISLKK